MSERFRPKPPRLVFVVLASVLFLLYLPIMVMMVNSFLDKVGGQYAWTLHWYGDVFGDSGLVVALERSVMVALTSSAGSVLLGTGAALSLARGDSRYRKMLEQLSLTSLIIPELVFALALLLWFFVINLSLSLFTVIIAHITFCLSFSILTIGGRLDTLDRSLDDGARDLGASDWQILTKITIPLLAPAILSSFVLSFLLSFDDFLITFFTNGPGSDTLPIKLYGSIKTGVTPKISALSSMMFLFSVLVIFGMKDVSGFFKSEKK